MRKRPTPVYDLPMRVEFNQLPADARLWVFAAERPLDDAEQARLLAAVDAFLDQWAAHGHPLTASRDLRYGQFLLVAVDESQAGPSGCSIDALTRTFGTLEHELGVELQNHAPVFYRDSAHLRRVDRPAFAELARQGAVSADTIVFDNTVSRVADVREGRWETRAGESWHAKAFLARA